jgi:hypothetical protein
MWPQPSRVDNCLYFRKRWSSSFQTSGAQIEKRGVDHNVKIAFLVQVLRSVVDILPFCPTDKMYILTVGNLDVGIGTSVARFFYQNGKICTKGPKNVLKDHKMYQMTTKCTK